MRVGATVGNSLSCEVTQDGNKFTSGPVMSTRMMPPPHLQAKETAVSKLLEELNCIAREGADLRFLASADSSFWTRPCHQRTHQLAPVELSSEEQQITRF